MRALDTLGQLEVDQNGWTNGDGVRDEGKQTGEDEEHWALFRRA